MTRPARPLPIHMPLSALLPPSTPSPADVLPQSLAILGPLPPTSAVHLALNYLYLSDLPDFDTAQPDDTQQRPRQKERVLIIIGAEDGFKHAVKEDDEDYLRENGGRYAVQDRLRRVDIRYCPTVKHAMLLLSLLTRGKEGPQQVASRPGLMVLWNLGSLLMDTEEANENVAEANVENLDLPRATTKRFRRDVIVSDYLDIISAAKASADHFSSLDITRAPTGLMVFEPEMTPDATLPILRAGGTAEMVPKGSRDKRIAVRTGLERLLGPQSFGGINPARQSCAYNCYMSDLMLTKSDTDDQGSAVYTLSLACHSQETFSLRRRPCPRADWYSPNRGEVDVDGLPMADGDSGGWRWEWT